MNDTQGDTIGNSDINHVPLFQVQYSEIIPKIIGVPPRTAIDDGVVARIDLLAKAVPPKLSTTVRVDEISPTGNETGYFVQGDPGAILGFNRITPMTVEFMPEPVPSLPLHKAKLSLVVFDGDQPVSGLKILVSRSTAGQPHDFKWSATTNMSGEAAVTVEGSDGRSPSGYYSVRAIAGDSDFILGHWSSIPVTASKTIDLILRVGEPARIKK